METFIARPNYQSLAQTLGPNFRCRYTGSNPPATTCINHSNPGTALLNAFGVNFEAREELVKLYTPLKLGQPADVTRCAMVRFEIDTILLNDCLGYIAHGNALLSMAGFGRALTESRDWHKIQHLAMDWMNFHHADYLKGRKRVFTKEILRMRNLKTFTIVGNYVWNAPRGTMETFMDLEEDAKETKTAGLIRFEAHDSVGDACESFKAKVAKEWKESVQWVIEKGKDEVSTEQKHNIPKLRVKALRMEEGHVRDYWNDEDAGKCTSG